MGQLSSYYSTKTFGRRLCISKGGQRSGSNQKSGPSIVEDDADEGAVDVHAAAVVVDKAEVPEAI